MSSTRRPIAAVIAAAILFGTSGTAQELGPQSATPLGVGAVRIAVGALTLWLFLVLVPSSPTRPELEAAIRSNASLIAIGGVGVALYTPLFLAAADRSGVAIATVVTIGSGPVFTALLEWATRGRSPSVGWAAGTIVTVAGAVLLADAVDAAGKEVDALGVLFALVAGAGYATYSVAAKTTMERGMNSTAALAAPFTVGAVVLAGVAVAQPYGWVATGSGFVMALHLGILATGVAYVLYGYGLDRLSAATTVTLVLAEPLTAVLLATLLLDESITPLGWLGVVLVLAGLFVVGRTADPTRPAPGSAPSSMSTA